MSNNHRSSKLTHQVYARTARPVASSLSDLIQTACLFSEKIRIRYPWNFGCSAPIVDNSLLAESFAQRGSHDISRTAWRETL